MRCTTPATISSARLTTTPRPSAPPPASSPTSFPGFEMGEQFRFDPAPADRAVARLTAILEQAVHDNDRISRLQHVTRPGDAPPTQAFHRKLTTSMSRLRDQHLAFVKTLEAQI